ERGDDALLELGLEVRDGALAAVRAVVGARAIARLRGAVLDDAERVHGALDEHAHHRAPLELHRRLAPALERLSADEAPAVDAVAPLELGERLVRRPVERAADVVALALEVALAREPRLRGADGHDARAQVAVVAQRSPLAIVEPRLVELG